MAAACEYARQGTDRVALAGMLDVAQDVTRPGFFLPLLQPTPSARPLLALALALARARGSHRRQSAALARAAVRHRPLAAAGALLAAALVIGLVAAGLPRLPLALGIVLALVAVVVLGLAAAAALFGPLVAIGREAWRGLPATGSQGLHWARGPGAPPALTDWLHARIHTAPAWPPASPSPSRCSNRAASRCAWWPPTSGWRGR